MQSNNFRPKRHWRVLKLLFPLELSFLDEKKDEVTGTILAKNLFEKKKVLSRNSANIKNSLTALEFTIKYYHCSKEILVGIGCPFIYLILKSISCFFTLMFLKMISQKEDYNCIMWLKNWHSLWGFECLVLYWNKLWNFKQKNRRYTYLGLHYLVKFQISVFSCQQSSIQN